MLEATPLFTLLAFLGCISTYIWGRIDERDKWVNINRRMQNVYESQLAHTPTQTPTHKYDINIIFEYLAAYHDVSNEPCVHRTDDTLCIEFDGALIALKDSGTWQWEDRDNN